METPQSQSKENPMRQTAREAIHSVMKGVDQITNWCFYAGAFLMLVLPFIMSYEVVMRYFFKRPTNFAVDFSEYIILYATLLAGGWLLKQGDHIMLTFFVERASERTRLILKILQSILGTLASAFLVGTSVEATWQSIARKSVLVRPLPVPKYVVLWIVGFCFLLFFIYFLKQLVDSIAALRPGKSGSNQKGTDG
jgi:TRAP-type C4-dicarboxylate transport system permease small subunit